MEVRGADAGPWRRVCALPAFWVGLLYEPDILAEAADLVSEWRLPEDAIRLRDLVPKSGLATPFGDGTVLDVARRVVELASDGLRRRGRISKNGADERIYIRALEETVERGESPADRLLAEYRGEWNGDAREIFRRYAY
jgi:glutamate--cysteine ligase